MYWTNHAQAPISMVGSPTKKGFARSKYGYQAHGICSGIPKRYEKAEIATLGASWPPEIHGNVKGCLLWQPLHDRFL